MTLAASDFVIRPLPTMIFGAGSSRKIADHVRSLGASSALIVTDRHLHAAGLTEPLVSALRAANIAVEVFAEVEPNPTDRNVEDGAAALKALPGACVIAFGGGSSMDCGKAIALLEPNAATVIQLQSAAPSRLGRPVIAIPTTAGTGSETNSACVITNIQMGRKTYVMHPSITPRVAILDAELTVGLPAYPSATCGFDVLTHAIEALVSLRATPYSDGVALSAIQIAADNVLEVVSNGGNLEARSQMLLASSMAAIAFNVSGLGSTHGTGHAISARLNAAHGQTLATMLPHVMNHNMPVAGAKYGQVAERLQAFGGAPGSGDSAIEAVLQLRAALAIDRSIRDLGAVERSLIDTLVEDALADPVNRSNPVAVGRDDFEAMYRAAW